MAETAPSKVVLPPVLTVKELAEALDKPVTAVIAELMKNGVMATINEDVDFDTAAIIASELGVEVSREEAAAEEVATPALADDPKAVPRPPVVTVLGHVDHGKTTLLDAIREANVAGGESGGITQHIGAYQVEVTQKSSKGKRLITFLDTPGHEAFSAMRAHGTKMTDVAILVVAADDGVKPQTIEAIEHIKSAETPYVVAVTKTDKPGADLNKVKQELAEHEVVSEDWGGTVVFVPTSAKTGDGIPDLLEMVLLVSDIAAPKANPAADFAGVVIESRLSRAKGPVATILVENGTLRVGDYVVIEDGTGRIRLMENFHGKRITEAVPGTPVLVAGLTTVPSFGAAVTSAADEKSARSAASLNMRRGRARMIDKPRLSAETIHQAVQSGKVQQLPIIVVADVKGSLEALQDSFAKIPQDQAAIQLVQTSVGLISESHIRRAASGGATIVGFKTKVEPSARAIAKQLEVKISLYDVIYELLDDIRKTLESMLPPEIVVNEVGQGEVLAIFRTTKTQQIIGCKVTEKKFVSGTSYRIGDQEETGKVVSLRRVDEEVQEVGSGTECGVTIEGPRAAVGDQINLFRRTEVAQKLA